MTRDGANESPTFDSDTEDDRRFAIIDASHSQDESRVPELLSLLQRDTYANRRHIVRALGKIGGADAKKALVQLLSVEEGLILGDIARSIGTLGVQGVNEILQTLLTHEVDWVRSGAREALHRLGGSPS